MEAQRQTFEELFEDHLSEIQRLIARHTDNPEDRLDLTQEVFIKAYSAFSQFRGDSHPRTWLHKITFNVCANALRSKKRQQKHLVEEPQDFEIPSGLYDVIDELAHQEEQRLLRQALRTLSAEQVLALSLRYSDQLTIPEIAEVLGAPVDTVKSRLRTALAKIQSAYSYLQSGIAQPDDCSKLEVVRVNELDGVLIQGEKGGRIYHNLGSLYLRKGMIEAALQEWSKAQTVAPTFLDAYITSAEQYIAMDQPIKAVDTLETAVSKIRNVELHIKLANLYLDVFRDVDEGIQHSAQALAIEPRNPVAHYATGRAYYEQAKLQQALVHSKQGQDLTESVLAGSWRKSASHFEEAVRLKGAFPGASSLLALTYLRQNRQRQATIHSQSAADDARDDEWVQYCAGWVHMELGKLDAAERYLRNSITSKPTPGALRTLGYVLVLQHRDEEASEYMQRAIDMSKDKKEKAHVSSNLAAAYLRLEKLDEAIEQAELAIRWNPEHVHAYCNLAEAHLRRGDNPRIAVNLSTEGLGIAPEHICFHRILAEAYYRLKNYKEAIAEATTAVELQPDHAQRWLLRAKILVALERYSEARADIMNALEIEPENAEAKTRLQRLPHIDDQPADD